MTGAGQSVSASWSHRSRPEPRSKVSKQANPDVLPRRLTGQLQASTKKTPWPVFLFILALIVPWVISIGPLRLSVYRIALLVLVLPCLIMWFTGRAGRIRLADVAVILFWFWSALGLVLIHGLETAVQPAGIGFVEVIGAYLLARCY